MIQKVRKTTTNEKRVTTYLKKSHWVLLSTLKSIEKGSTSSRSRDVRRDTVKTLSFMSEEGTSHSSPTGDRAKLQERSEMIGYLIVVQ